MLVEASGDAAELFEFAEEPLDQVAPPVEPGFDGALDADASLRGNMRSAAAPVDEIDKGPAVVAAICNQRRGWQPVDQERRHGLVRGLPRRENKADRQAVLIDHRMDLRAQSATRTAKGVIRAPLFPPAACW